MAELTFWPYCIARIKRDYKWIKHSKLFHMATFLLVAFVLAVVRQEKLSHVSFVVFLGRTFELFGEAIADRLVGFSVFKEGN